MLTVVVRLDRLIAPQEGTFRTRAIYLERQVLVEVFRI